MLGDRFFFSEMIRPLCFNTRIINVACSSLVSLSLSKLILSIKVKLQMTEFERFYKHWIEKNFAQCAKIVHGYIDSGTNQGVAFPADYLSRIESLLEALDRFPGHRIDTEQIFHELCSKIHLTYLEGPGNPSVNN
jgi:hypothetical protein